MTTPLERLRAWENRHDTAMPDELLYPQTEAERAQDRAMTGLRLAADFVRIAQDRMKAGLTDSAHVNIGNAMDHLRRALGEKIARDE